MLLARAFQARARLPATPGSVPCALAGTIPRDRPSEAGPQAVVMASYEFLTTWLLDAPREEVWDAIWESDEWPTWWRGVVEAAEVDPGTPCGVGRRGRYLWRSRIPYPVRFEIVSTVVERPVVLAGEATGELEGLGRWRFFEQDGATAVLYEWNVRTTKPWMNAIAPLAAPAFRWNHDRVMRWGGEGIARHLGCRLLASS